MITWDVALLIAVLLAIALFIPRWGIVSRRNQARRKSERILREDALKHIYHCEYSGITCSLESLAGALGLNGDRTASLLEELSRHRLISYAGAVVTLSEEGRAYALSVIRVHRLWERYLADETAVKKSRWHEEAEKQEHRLSDSEIRELSKRLGHPLFDPHGDPIPGPEGTIPGQLGKPLRNFSEGDTLRVTHVEDEPVAVYSQIVDAGVFPGSMLRIVRRTEESVDVESDERRLTFSTTLAANIHARKIPGGQYGKEKRTLSSLAKGSSGVVLGISDLCQGLQRRRLMDLGLVPGTLVSAEIEGTGGDPIAYNIRGATIALRREQANHVYLEDEGE